MTKPIPARGVATRRNARHRRPARRAGLAAFLLAVAAGCGPSDPLAEIRELHARGRFHDSIESLRALLGERRDDPELYYLYGTALLGIGEPTLAEWPLRRAMQDPEWTVVAGKLLASSEYQSGNHTSAVATLTEVLAEAPDDVEARALRAIALAAGRQRYEEVLADTDRVLELDPENLMILQPRIVALLGLDRIDEAAETIERLKAGVEEQGLGGDARLCTVKALFLVAEEDFEGAEATFEACLEQHPRNALLIQRAVEYYESHGRLEDSLAVLQGALESLPESRAYRSAVAARLRALGRADEALALLLEATGSEVPEQAVAAWIDVSNHYLEQGRLEEAADAARQAYEGTDRPSHDLLFMYADALILTERYDEVRPVIERMTVPSHRAFAEGRLLMETGRQEEALERFAEGATLWPNNAAVRYLAGRAAEQIGDIDRAIEEFRQSVRSSGEGNAARVRLAQLHLAEGALEAAQLAAKDDGRVTWLEDPDLANVEVRAMRQGMEGALPVVRAVPVEGGLRARAAAAMLRGLRRGDHPLSEDDFQAATGLEMRHPENFPALRELVRLQLERDHGSEARELAQAAVEAVPAFAPFHALLGRTLQEAGADAEAARAAFDRALELDPQQPLALEGRARMALAADDAGTAARLLEGVVGRSAERLEAWRLLAEAYAALDRPDERRRALRGLLAEDPTDVPAALALVDLDLAQQRVDARSERRAAAAVRFGGGAPASDALERVRARLAERGEGEAVASGAG